MVTLQAASPEETRAIACDLGKRLTAGTCIAFRGGLGAGKTTFTRGLVQGLGLPDIVSSPTFALVNEYHAPGCLSLYHFDMYRVDNLDALETTGFWDYPLEESVFVIEWSEQIAEALPPDRIDITITGMGDAPRTITMEGVGRFAAVIG